LFQKINAQIIGGIVLCSLVLASVIGAFSMIRATQTIKSEAEDKILYYAKGQGNAFSIMTTKMENTTSEIANLIMDHLDFSKATQDDYILQFEKEMSPVFQSLGIHNQDIIGLYFNFDPSFTSGSQAFDIAYFYDTTTKTGEIQLNDYDLEEFFPNNEDLDWYYAPIKAKKGGLVKTLCGLCKQCPYDFLYHATIQRLYFSWRCWH
jgi:methyl-accepting chemotaxis protein